MRNPMAIFIKLENGVLQATSIGGKVRYSLSFRFWRMRKRQIPRIEYRLRMLYPDSHFEIAANGERITLKCINQSGGAFEQEYYNFEIVYEGNTGKDVVN